MHPWLLLNAVDGDEDVMPNPNTIPQHYHAYRTAPCIRVLLTNRKAMRWLIGCHRNTAENPLTACRSMACRQKSCPRRMRDFILFSLEGEEKQSE